MSIHYSPTTVTNGLVLSLDAGNSKSYPGSGTTWTDLSGNGNTGTLTNGPTYSSANGGSIVFDGVNDYVGAGNSISGLNGTAVTVSAWVRTNSIGGEQYLLDASTNGGSGNGLSIRIRANGSIRFWNYNATYNANSASILSANTWYYIAGTWDGTTSRVYINGLPDGTNTGDANFLGSIYQIGHSNMLGGFFNGNISSVSIYNRALSAAEIYQNFNALRGRYGV